VGSSLDILSGSRLGQHIGVRCCAEKSKRIGIPYDLSLTLKCVAIGEHPDIFSHTLICCYQ